MTRTAFVTGGTGFVGLNLVQQLIAGGWDVTALLGKSAPKKEMPASMVRVAATLADFVSKFTGKEPTITRDMAKSFSRAITVSAAKAQRELGFGIVPLNTMVKDCYDWMLAEGRI